jgi:hypothetical protein
MPCLLFNKEKINRKNRIKKLSSISSKKPKNKLKLFKNKKELKRKNKNKFKK